MNSKDRRKHRREFPHTYILETFGRKLTTGNNFYSMRDWCTEQFGDEYRIEGDGFWKPYVIGFKNESHKSWFALRWSHLL